MLQASGSKESGWKWGKSKKRLAGTVPQHMNALSAELSRVTQMPPPQIAPMTVMTEDGGSSAPFIRSFDNTPALIENLGVWSPVRYPISPLFLSRSECTYSDTVENSKGWSKPGLLS